MKIIEVAFSASAVISVMTIEAGAEYKGKTSKRRRNIKVPKINFNAVYKARVSDAEFNRIVITDMILLPTAERVMVTSKLPDNFLILHSINTCCVEMTIDTIKEFEPIIFSNIQSESSTVPYSHNRFGGQQEKQS